MSAFTLSFALTALLSASALAAPERVPRDATGVLHAGALVTPQPQLSDAGADYDFAGALFQAGSSTTFTSVAATFTIPTPSVPSGMSASNNYYFSLWAGINLLTTPKQGGFAANEGLLQTGCDINTQKTLNGHAYQCWVEYFPAGTIYIDMYPEPGDQISVGVKALSPTVGVVSIRNLNGTATFTSTMSAPSPSNTILGAGNVAEFLLETTVTPTIPAFKPAVTFSNANVYNKAGALVPLANLPDIEVERNGNDETKTSYTAHNVVIQYLHS